jgi:hypothetical protein
MLVATCPSCNMGNVQLSDEQLTEYLDDCNAFVQTKLQLYNSIEGIEHLGGPFQLDDYSVEYNYDSRKQSVEFNYIYKKPHGIEGCPDNFEIEIWNEPSEDSCCSGTNFLSAEEGSFVVKGDFKENELKEILTASGTSLQGKHPIFSINKLSEEKVQVAFNLMKDYSREAILLPKVPDAAIIFQRTANTWQVEKMLAGLDNCGYMRLEHFPLLSKPTPENLSFAVKQVKVRGILSEDDIGKICELVLRLRDIDHRIMRLEVKGADYAEVWTGKGRGNSVYLRKVGDTWIVTGVSVWAS